MQKESIAVYNPSDPIEKAVQDSYHKFNDDWLFPYPCKLFANAIISLKSVDDVWLESPHLLSQRLDYFFAPFMISKNKVLAFLTHKLFLRDVLENNKINCFLHQPVVLMNKPIAHYIFREYPIVILLDGDKVLDKNSFTKVGGLFISEEHDVNIEDCIIEVIDRNSHNLNKKVAATEIQDDVFKIDSHNMDLTPGDLIWNKQDRSEYSISEVEPGDSGYVYLQKGKIIKTVPKKDFDVFYTKVAELNLQDEDVGNIIKSHLVKSKSIQKLFQRLNVPIEKIESLQYKLDPLVDEKIYAETDMHLCRVRQSLFKHGIEYFIKNYMYIMAHEIVHFVFRQAQNQSLHDKKPLGDEKNYFNDPEEIVAFCVSVAYEIEQKKQYKEIFQTIYPKIEFHFNTEDGAKEFFNEIYKKAQRYLSSV